MEVRRWTLIVTVPTGSGFCRYSARPPEYAILPVKGGRHSTPRLATAAVSTAIWMGVASNSPGPMARLAVSPSYQDREPLAFGPNRFPRLSPLRAMLVLSPKPNIAEYFSITAPPVFKPIR